MPVAEAGHDVFQAIADPTRRSLLKLLANKEMSIASITDCYPISRTAVNKHLQVLSDAQLVSSQKVGRETRYKLQPEPLLELQDWLAFFEGYWANKLFALKEYVESDSDEK
ncbi:transcriptional regulator [Paenibacillus odorifer]|jgi:DNA-binding transcriptional ArsR family regulator|uniref:Transcriptional regulator n=1 Tax=Paenibacillus odorifer TaxID=189426 RepID=A0ABX3GGQ8_9BACL|nr:MULTISPECIES: metalloregulator ArsR/SmtB family transcription factor [Paenibacillus]MDH6428283.1 DNA-binding transcriptional ArsR family regulator [Paenibacillus sp. PastH-4]MDH6444085.1 DNA-binding transcriptional ArsR family regulator [Paenibacillus sp. PastF-4]MDH6527988.1 DNA-binding transcriptional ArsR family regulator [Paenibacillus sp. PastH-3]OMC69719.1 transcriptional regulator [Paenibacillus odorifer]OMD19372.1 transcriptional regulator [Paenibacillus odorifer]